MSFKTILRKAITTLLTLAITITVLTQLPHAEVQAASGTWGGGHIYKDAYWLRVDWSESAQNPKTNTSTLSATVYLVQKANYSLSISASKPVTIKIGSNTYSTKTGAAIKNSGGVTTKLGTYSVSVVHNANGSLNVPISASFDIAATLGTTYYKTMTTSNTAVLDTLDRALPSITPSVSNITANSVTLKGVANSVSDSWAYSKDGGTTWTAFGTTGTTNTVTLSGLSANTTYSLRVRARKTLNNLTGTSNVLSVTTAPSAVVGLRVEKQSVSSARLTWSATSGATSYNVYKDGALVSSGVKTLTYTFEGLISGVENTFSVSAINSVGTTGVVNAINFMLEPSSDPSNLKVSSSSLSSMTLEWEAVPGAATYSVFKNDTLVLSGIKVLSYTFSGLKPGESAIYGVRADNAGGVSGISILEFTVPPKEAPTGLGIIEEMDNYTRMSWDPVEGALAYHIYLNGNLIAENVTETYFDFEELTGATVHELGVSAVNKGGITSPSQLEYTTHIKVPSNLTITTQTSKEVSLSWNKQGTRVGYYNIYRDGVKIGESTTSSFIDTTYQNTLSTYNVSAVDLENNETDLSLGVVIKDLEGPTITLEIQESSAISLTLKSIFEDALSGVDETSYKWAYGTHSLEYFVEKGTPYEAPSLMLSRNGIYTIYAKDNAGNGSVILYEVNSILSQKVVGGFEYEEADLSIDAPGIPIEFTRTYDSTNTKIGPLGRGWRFSFMGSLEFKDNYAFVTLSQGNPLIFEQREGSYEGINTYASLGKSGSNWLLKDAYYTYTFNAKGALVKIADRNGNVTTIEVNDLGYPTKIIDSVGREYILSYTNNLLTSLSDPVGRTLSYNYNGGNLISVRNFKGEIMQSYDYDEAARIVSIKNSYNAVVSSQTYDSNHRIVTQTIENDTREYSYSIDDAAKQALTSNEKTSLYDTQGNILLDEEGSIFIYDEYYGNLLSKKTSEHEETLYTYDQHGELLTATTKDSKGRVTETISINMTYFEASGRLRIRVETTTTTEYPEEKEPLIEVSVITTTYDDKGNPLTIQEKSEDSDITMSNTFEVGGKITSSIDKSGLLTTFLYDRYGYPTQITTQAQNEDPVDTKYTSNSIGFVLKLESNRGVRSTFVYDVLGNVLKTESIETGSEARITRSIYNSKNEKIHEIGALDYKESQDIIAPNDHGISITDGYKDIDVGIRYSYNSAGKLIETKAGSYVLESDSKGNISKVSVGGNTLASYVYKDDEESLLESLTYGNDATLTYTYDDKGNRTALSGDDIYYEYLYDDEDRLTKKINRNMSIHTTYEYLENGDVKVVVKEREILLDSYTLSKDSQQFTHVNKAHTYLYNYSDKGTEVYSKDTVEFLRKETQRGKEDRKEKEVYTKNSETLLTSEYNYDAEGLIRRYTNTYKDLSFDSYQYEYDGYGNITKVLQNDQELARYTYDKANQLKRVDDKTLNETHTFEYDTKGNILEKRVYSYTIGTISASSLNSIDQYEYSNPNFPDQLTSLNDESIRYDALGNPINYKGWEMSWVNGRQLDVMRNNRKRIEFMYDDEGIRYAKEVEGELTLYTSIEGRITSQRDDHNNLEFHYDSDQNLVGFTLNDDQEYLYVKNIQNDIIGILDKDGNKVVSYAYDAWGKTTSITGSLAATLGELNPMRYRSYYLDVETSLYYLVSRYYDPEIGRFINVDEPQMVSFSIFNNTPYNPFSYCINSPVNYSDPIGYSILVPISGPGKFYKNYKQAVEVWGNKYAPMSREKEYGAFIYRFRVLWLTYYIMGETYQGYQTKNWYTVLNGLAIGYIVGGIRKTVINSFWPVASLLMIGFAHTHPIGGNTKPSVPFDWLMKGLFIFRGTTIFPIATLMNGRIRIDYF